MTLKKIISGGQTGADQGGLEGALYLGLETGGWMPKGFLTEDGPRPDFEERYGLREHRSPKYPPRTAANVRDSQATAWFGRTGSPGFHCTRSACAKYGRPFRVIESAEALRAFVAEFNVVVLNVAGNRESKNPGLRDRVVNLIREAFARPTELAAYRVEAQ